MTFDQAVPIVEGKLYAYGVLRLEYPEASISGAYRKVIQKHEVGIAPRGTEDHTSPQERWAVQNQGDIVDAMRVERVLLRLSDEQCRLVQLRYVDRWPWSKVAQKLCVSRRTIFRIRDGVLTVFAYEFGMLQDVPQEAS